MRGTGSSMEVPQTINVVAAQVIRDQAPRNLDDALNNISGITQGNTLGGTQDSVMKRGFGDNRDGSIMRDGMPLVQGRALNAATERVEALKGPASLLYGIQDPGGERQLAGQYPGAYYVAPAIVEMPEQSDVVCRPSCFCCISASRSPLPRKLKKCSGST